LAATVENTNFANIANHLTENDTNWQGNCHLPLPKSIVPNLPTDISDTDDTDDICDISNFSNIHNFCVEKRPYVAADLDDFAVNSDIKCTVKMKNVKKFAKRG